MLSIVCRTSGINLKRCNCRTFQVSKSSSYFPSARHFGELRNMRSISCCKCDEMIHVLCSKQIASITFSFTFILLVCFGYAMNTPCVNDACVMWCMRVCCVENGDVDVQKRSERRQWRPQAISHNKDSRTCKNKNICIWAMDRIEWRRRTTDTPMWLSFVLNAVRPIVIHFFLRQFYLCYSSDLWVNKHTSQFGRIVAQRAYRAYVEPNTQYTNFFLCVIVQWFTKQTYNKFMEFISMKLISHFDTSF